MARHRNPENVGKSPAEVSANYNAQRREKYARDTAVIPKQKRGRKRAPEFEGLNDEEYKRAKNSKRTKACRQENLAIENTRAANLDREIKKKELDIAEKKLEKEMESNQLMHMKEAMLGGIQHTKEGMIGVIDRQIETRALQSRATTPVSLVDEPPEPEVVDLTDDEPTVQAPHRDDPEAAVESKIISDDEREHRTNLAPVLSQLKEAIKQRCKMSHDSQKRSQPILDSVTELAMSLVCATREVTLRIRDLSAIYPHLFGPEGAKIHKWFKQYTDHFNGRVHQWNPASAEREDVKKFLEKELSKSGLSEDSILIAMTAVCSYIEFGDFTHKSSSFQPGNFQKNVELRHQLSSTKSELEESVNKGNRLQKDVDELTDANEKLKSKNDELEWEKHGLKSDNTTQFENLQKDIVDLKEQHETDKILLERKDQRVKRKEARIETLDKRIFMLKKELRKRVSPEEFKEIENRIHAQK